MPVLRARDVTNVPVGDPRKLRVPGHVRCEYPGFGSVSLGVAQAFDHDRVVLRREGIELRLGNGRSHPRVQREVLDRFLVFFGVELGTELQFARLGFDGHTAVDAEII